MSKDCKNQNNCRICKSKGLYKFLDLGSMPIPNGFLKKEDLHKHEKKYELACCYCERCGLVQLSNVVNPELMFKNYVYIPSTAKVMMNNFSNLAYEAHQRLQLNEKSLVVDIGSNDGSLLAFFKGFGCRVLGIDPAVNLAKVAELNGIPTEVKMFGTRSAKIIARKYGKADVITATNVIAHIDNLHQVFKGVNHLLSKDGIFITEFPYLLDLITKNQFDTIYHEHLSYFSLRPWKILAENYGFEIIGAERKQIHGGSIRLIHQRKNGDEKHTTKVVDYLISLEEKHGLYSKSSYDKFAKRISDLKIELNELLVDLKKKKKKIVGCGAAAKGNVLTNFFNIGTETLDYIVDSTSYKQGLYTPGKHIPVYPESKLINDQPDYSLILAWNFADEIIEKHKLWRKKGGKFIVPIPKVKIV